MYSLYEIPRRSRSCFQCQAPFLPGSVYYSLLSENFERRDCCAGCFQNQPDKGKIYWKALIPEKPKQNTRHSERALSLLREIYKEQKETAYILALYLQRQKVIIRRQEVDEAILFEVVETEEILSIHKVDPERLDADLLQSQIAKKLEE